MTEAKSVNVSYNFHLRSHVISKRGNGTEEMNDFPVIGDLVMRTALWDRQGANIASRCGVELFLRLKPVSLDRECRILP